LTKLVARLLCSAAGVAIVTLCAYRLIPVNATTIGFAYLVLVLIIASTWGFFEAALASILATLAYNFFFLPPVGTFTIADPQNWVALLSFLSASLIASRLSDKAEQRAKEAVARRQDVEHLYSFSRSILLIEGEESFPKQLAQQLAEAFGFDAVLLYDRRADQIYRGGPADFDGLEDQLRESARHGVSFADPAKKRVITAVRLGSEPIAALALQGSEMPDSVLQGIGNLVAIGLERARAQELAHQMETAQRSEQLRTTLLDAIAHEFKTPLTSIKAATTALLAHPGQQPDTAVELLTIADEEAERLKILIDDALELASIDRKDFHLSPAPTAIADLVRESVESVRIDARQLTFTSSDGMPMLLVDKRLIRLAIRQIVDNALKYSPPGTPIEVHVASGDSTVWIDIVDHGEGIAPKDQERIFERFYRGPSTSQVPGSGLGLSIANSIVRAHGGTLSVSSRTGETTFRIALPATSEGAQQ
jgi:two-component system, OmpR family, sensor histidine kinase KdpD